MVAIFPSSYSTSLRTREWFVENAKEGISGFDGEKTLPRSTPFCVFIAWRNCLLDIVSSGEKDVGEKGGRGGRGEILEGFHSGGWLFIQRWTVRVNGVVHDHSERAGYRTGMSRDISLLPNERLIFPNNNKNRVLVLVILYYSRVFF